MDAQRTFEGAGFSKTAVAFVVVTVAALLLGGASGYAVKGLSVGSGAIEKAPQAQTQHQAAGWAGYRPQRGGIQIGAEAVTTENVLGAAPSRPGGARF